MLAEDYGVPFLGEIPLDARIRASADEGTPVAAVGDPVSRSIFAEIAARLVAAMEAREPQERVHEDARREVTP
jgi:ATP-binding protein involved in chromosome partitioning